MSPITCKTCRGTGFLNAEELDQFQGEADFHGAVLDWLYERESARTRLGGCSCHVVAPCSYCEATTDVAVCDCCGDGRQWYGTPGQHYGPDDPIGPLGPYGHTSGLAKCHFAATPDT